MKRTMYSVQTAPLTVECYTDENIDRICYTRFKLWATIRFTIACWFLKKGRTCHIVTCRPPMPIDKWDLKGSCSGYCENCNEMICCDD